MKRVLLVLASAILLLTTAQARQTSKDDAERLLKAAQNTEVVDGNPRAAIKEYQAIVDRFSKTERRTAATALLRMAECHRKLGDEEAQKIYRQLVRDYADQPATASQARVRLAAMARSMPQGGTVERRVFAGQSAPFQFGGVSRDGRRLLYTYNYGSKDEAGKWGLYIRDLSSGTSRRLVARTSMDQVVDYRSALSRNNQQVAYSWLVASGRDRRMELRTMSVDAPAASPRVLVSNDDIDWIAAHDWTPDGKSIAVDVRRTDNTRQIGLVSTIDGSLRVLKSVNWDRPGRIALSPDGKYLAFGQRDADDFTDDIHVLATDGSREFPAVVFKGSDLVAGWSEDGTQLLFLSDRTGSFGVWSQQFTDRPSGAPKLIKADVGARDVIGLTSAGALYYVTETPVRRSDLKYASLDLAEGRVLSQPVIAVQEHVGTNDSPQWSHDGKHLAYLSRRQNEKVLVMRSSEDNRIVREWVLKLVRVDVGTLHWTPDDRSLTVDGEAGGRSGVFRIDAQTGQMTPSVLQPVDARLPTHQWSADAKTLYFTRLSNDLALIALDVASNKETDIMRAPGMGPDGTYFAVSPDDRTVYFTRHVTPRASRERGDNRVEIVARDIATGAERTLWDRASGAGNLNLSPDGRYIVRNGSEPPGRQFMLIPTTGGEPRPLMTIPGSPVCWSADGRALVVKEFAPSTGVWLVPVDGREPKKLNMELEGSAQQFSLHPDGQRVVFFQSVPTGPPGRQTEVWVVENLLPASAPPKK